ncbi:MAG TPA: ribulose-phosphate 3-epimerase [Candidatus Treponema faecavium]|nr:ribulose-phosphate 3-epimerase [Candidatus Treponema faecavium]
MNKIILAPSLLAADCCNLGAAVKQIEAVPSAWIHFDVMDGSFVPHISFGVPVLASLRRITSAPVDVHLMVCHPETHIPAYIEAGADHITFQYEAAVHHHRIIEQIHTAGKKAGIAIVPSTPVCALAEILPDVDIVLVMTVNPGFGGQKLIRRCLDKAALLADLRSRHGYSYVIAADGGITKENIAEAGRVGVDVAVSGTAFFSGALSDSLRS